ncbi:TPA: hypothetical protein ACGW5B_004785 [Bacillus paranthracis]|uniref:hypothetical protein n=1 Tax=Bacillus TaxID=1386 RepID=UPI00142EC199|nr:MULTISPECIES: hypothetical protein [Bacillus]MED1134504.1 hypothetical protein [Bacillus paranthracis]HDR4705708.1 hypothetical protein [Bacillus paranthracis]HDR7274763.1 hypothetical protein [Bacillus paranthracis]HDR7281534.1 hypothetical protein [Bacillus paranthracis]HDR7305204.1 hypothetical protein [Bacillus paranthracis]
MIKKKTKSFRCCNNKKHKNHCKKNSHEVTCIDKNDPRWKYNVIDDDNPEKNYDIFYL